VGAALIAINFPGCNFDDLAVVRDSPVVVPFLLIGKAAPVVGPPRTWDGSQIWTDYSKIIDRLYEFIDFVPIAT
jgi:hypothetical protein